MVENQKARFSQNGYNELVQNYLRSPEEYEDQYLKMIGDESVAQYRDYFESEKEDLDMAFFSANKHKMATVFENWTIERRDRSAYESFPLPEWNN